MSLIAQISCTTMVGCASSPSVPADRSVTGGCGAMPDPRWFVLQTHQQAERWAAENLGRAGFTTFLPMITELRRDRVVRTMMHKVRVPCFAGYLFVQFCPATDAWRPVIKSEGVRRMFTTASDRPIPVRRGEVEKLRGWLDAKNEPLMELPAFATGTELRVTAGPFADRDGVCLWSSETRVRLLMQVLGSEVAVDVARGAVTAVDQVP